MKKALGKENAMVLISEGKGREKSPGNFIKFI